MNRVPSDPSARAETSHPFRKEREMDGAPGYFGCVFTHLRKDLRLEWRSRDSVVGMLFFALLVVIIFSLAFDPTAAISREIAGGILWVALLFASFTALNQSWTREQRNRVLDAQRMSSAPPSALFLGKALANLIFVSFVEVVLAPLFIVFYNLHALGQGWMFAIVMPLGTWALVCNGTFFAALGLRTRFRADAAADPGAHLAARAAGNDAGDDGDPDRRERSWNVDSAADRLQHHLHYGVHAAV